MAIYSMNISNVSRGKGSSTCATASYITGTRIKEDRTGNIYDYGRKERVEHVSTLLPDSAPKEFSDPKILFNSIENFESAENARTGKKIMVALPREFDLKKQIEVVEEFIVSNVTSLGYPATYAIHTDDDNNNPHAHILIANRPLDDLGWKKTKSKKIYALDDDGERIPIIDPNTGAQKVDSRNRKQWRRVSVEVNPLDLKETLEGFRKNWAMECNKHLEGKAKITHKSHAELGLDLLPTIHEGHAAREMAKRGEPSERVDHNNAVRESNRLMIDITLAYRHLRALEADLRQFIAGLRESIKERIKTPRIEPQELKRVSEMNKPVRESIFDKLSRAQKRVDDDKARKSKKYKKQDLER